LEAALSEKDAHVALLEVTGVKNAKQADQLDQLRADRARLTLRLQVEVKITCKSYNIYIKFF
jgi:hypothetical protein